MISILPHQKFIHPTRLWEVLKISGKKSVFIIKIVKHSQFVPNS